MSLDSSRLFDIFKIDKFKHISIWLKKYKDRMKQLAPAPIGIDLGTYKSKIAVAKRGGV